VNMIEAKFLFDEAAGDGNVDAIEISDRTDDEHPEDEDPAHSGGLVKSETRIVS
jgi:hypothetical protein